MALFVYIHKLLWSFFVCLFFCFVFSWSWHLVQNKDQTLLNLAQQDELQSNQSYRVVLEFCGYALLNFLIRRINTAQKMNSSIKGFFSKCDQIGHIY